MGIIHGKDILNPVKCFEVIDNASKMKCYPIIWNHWDEDLPTTEPDRLGNLLKGRAVECCAPIVISDKTGIRDLIELSNYEKLPVRRPVTLSETMVELEYAFGLLGKSGQGGAFGMVMKHIPSYKRAKVLETYRNFCHGMSTNSIPATT